MILTTELAKQLAKKYFIESKIKDGKLFYSHTEGVVEAVKLLAKRENLELEQIESYAWVHDIGYFLSQENHAEKSLELLEKEKIEIDSILKDCVLNHGNNKEPKTKYGELMQIADKISIMNKDFLNYLLNHKIDGDEIAFIKMIFDKATLMLEKLKNK